MVQVDLAGEPRLAHAPYLFPGLNQPGFFRELGDFLCDGAEPREELRRVHGRI